MTEERIDIGADVIGSAGDKVGTVAYVVVQPPRMHVTDYVVSTGLLGRDVVVPIDKVDHVADGKVYLSLDANGLNQLDDYIEVQYTQPPQEWAPPVGSFLYPAQSIVWPAGAYYPEASSVTVNTPQGSVGLHEGMDVESSDGHKVGAIKAIEEDPASGDVTEIIIKEGHLFSHDARIPASLIAEVHEGRVTLSVTRDDVPQGAP